MHSRNGRNGGNSICLFAIGSVRETQAVQKSASRTSTTIAFRQPRLELLATYYLLFTERTEIHDHGSLENSANNHLRQDANPFSRRRTRTSTLHRNGIGPRSCGLLQSTNT